MPWPEFKARENLAALRSGLAYAGAMRRLNPTGVSMNLTNRLRVEFGFDADGMIGANDISAATDLLINLHMWANFGTGRQYRRVARGYAARRRRIPSIPEQGTKRGPRNRPNRATCWWEEEPYGRS
ncbi:hypothetical protein SNK04_014311 [Fusarium graminearum]